MVILIGSNLVSFFNYVSSSFFIDDYLIIDLWLFALCHSLRVRLLCTLRHSITPSLTNLSVVLSMFYTQNKREVETPELVVAGCGIGEEIEPVAVEGAVLGAWFRM